MPLKKGYSAKTIGLNIGTEMKKHPSMSHKQAVAVAIAMSMAYKAAPKKKKSKYKKK